MATVLTALPLRATPHPPALLLACSAMATVTAAQEAPAANQTIVEVVFDGNQRTGEAFLREIVRTRPGDPFNESTLAKDAAALLRTGRFIHVEYERQDVQGGVRVVFHLVERPVVTAVTFTGNSEFNDAALAKIIPVAAGDALDDFLVQEGRESILKSYRDKGYGQVSVTVDRGALDQGEVAYIIEEGPRVRVRKIQFEGRRALEERELVKQITTKTVFWIFREGILDEERVENDAARLQLFCRNQGFLDARVGYRIDPGEKPGDRVVVFTMDEGPRYRVEDVRFEGNTVFPTEELMSLLETKPGAYFTQDELDADRRMLLSRYGRIGYIYREVRALRVFSDTPERVIVTFRITEGEQFRVGRVVVRGNMSTKDKVVLREFHLYPPDDLFNLDETRQTEQRLRQTRIFKSARVIPSGEQPGMRDVLIDVEENERVDNFTFGFGVTSNSGLVGTFVLSLNNFDLFDTPRSFAEFVRFRAFHGAGQRLRIEAQPGTELSRLRLDFTEPYLFDRPLRLDTGIYLFTRGRDGYNERRTGAYVSFGKRFERGTLRRWSGELALRVEDVSIRDLDLFTHSEIREDEGGNLMTSAKVSLVLDRTDNRFLPSTGDRWRLSYEQFGVLGGDHSFGKARAAYSRFMTVRTDVLGRKDIFALRAETASIVGNAPVFERYYAGGIGSIRGFDFRGVGPRLGIDDNPVGGEFLVLLGAEYTFPIYGDNLRGVLFTDMGTVESNIGISDWRASIGAGVRLTVDLIGPLPIEFDLAAPISTGPDDDEQAFSFFIGGTLF